MDKDNKEFYKTGYGKPAPSPSPERCICRIEEVGIVRGRNCKAQHEASSVAECTCKPGGAYIGSGAGTIMTTPQFCPVHAKTPVAERVWCEHITKKKSYRKSVDGVMDWMFKFDEETQEFNFCPICAAPRPQDKPRTLVEAIKSNFPYGHPAMSEENWRSTANAALAWFREKVKKQTYMDIEGVVYVPVNALLRAIE